MRKSVKRGWLPFSEFAVKYGISLTEGNAYKKLHSPSYDPKMKDNMTPNSPRATWAVNEEYAKARFKV